MSSRLFQTIREDQGLCYSVFSYHSSYEHVGTVTLYAGTQLTQLEKLSEAMAQVTQNVQQQGITKKRAREWKRTIKRKHHARA